jgi:predicted small secreted protein
MVRRPFPGDFEWEAIMKPVVVCLLLMWAVTLTGCETMKGLGKDMEKAGEAIQKKASK